MTFDNAYQNMVCWLEDSKLSFCDRCKAMALMQDVIEAHNKEIDETDARYELRHCPDCRDRLRFETSQHDNDMSFGRGFAAGTFAQMRNAEANEQRMAQMERLIGDMWTCMVESDGSDCATCSRFPFCDDGISEFKYRMKALGIPVPSHDADDESRDMKDYVRRVAEEVFRMIARDNPDDAPKSGKNNEVDDFERRVYGPCNVGSL